MAKKIGFGSRYYESFRILKDEILDRNVFEFIHNEDKNTYSLPFLYENYQNKLDVESISSSTIGLIKRYFKDNLFNDAEIELLMSNLMPYIENYGNETIARLSRQVDYLNRTTSETTLKMEFNKTIDSLLAIRENLTREFTMNKVLINEEIPTVFVSYSHDNEEHKDWVLQLATRLRSNGVNIILDRWNLTLGSDLASFMERGLSKSHRIICVCSEKYVEKANNGIGGAGYEKQIMTAELVADQNTNWVIPLIKSNPNNRKTPIFLAGRMYIDFEESNLYETKYEELLRDLLDERVLPIPPLGENPFQTTKEFSKQKFIASNEKYASPAPKGTITFDYSNNNGRYCIGQGELMFEIAFSKSSDRNIIVYNDPTSILRIARVKGISDLNLIKDAREFDYSSRARRPNINEIALLQNSNGFYAGIKILNIKDYMRGAENDEITFEYFIQTNGSPNFEQ